MITMTCKGNKCEKCKYIDKDRLYDKAIKVWGMRAQIDMAVEECAELIKALQKRKRVTAYETIDNILEEMADVEIMIEQLKLMYDYSSNDGTKFESIKQMKLKRLAMLLE